MSHDGFFHVQIGVFLRDSPIWRLISPVRPGENLLLPHGHVGGELVSAALPVEPHEDPGEVHQPALLAEDDVEEVPVLALPASPPQGHFCLLVLAVPVSLGILRYINPGGNFQSVVRLLENSFHLQ